MEELVPDGSDKNGFHFSSIKLKVKWLTGVVYIKRAKLFNDENSIIEYGALKAVRVIDLHSIISETKNSKSDDLPDVVVQS